MYLSAFSDAQYALAKKWLCTQVTTMMGRKMEEGDWSRVYCLAKDIPEANWSNLHIDINHQGLGVELKMLRVPGLRDRPLKSVCGTTLMHPSATRSIRIEDVQRNADDVMREVFTQYAQLIDDRAATVREVAPDREPDMRIGWLIWEDNLAEFLYFEEPMRKPDADQYYAEWSITPAKGARKESKSLWIYEKSTRRKRYSVTTSAGIKIQPYFDVPAPGDPNLYYFRAQSEPLAGDRIRLWVAPSTAKALEAKLGSLDCERVTEAIKQAVDRASVALEGFADDDGFAVPIEVSKDAHALMFSTWEAVSDEHSAQLLLKALQEFPN